MAVLVTGGAGYIGSVTVDMLLERGDQVVVLDDLSRGHRDAVAAGATFYEGAVGDRALVARIAAEHDVEACVHFGSFIAVGESVADPAPYLENNVGQGLALFGALRDAGVMRVVFSSSAAVYGTPVEVPIPEEHPTAPESPYGWSKLALEWALADYHRAYGMTSVALRYFNACGATERRWERHDPETHLIPNILAAASGAAPYVSVFGGDYPTADGTAVRDYIHVADLAAAHLAALDHLQDGGSAERLNLGNGTGYSVLEVVEAARRVTGVDIEARIEGRRAGDPAVLVAGIDRATRALGWSPQRTDLDEIVASDWAWRRSPGG